MIQKVITSLINPVGVVAAIGAGILALILKNIERKLNSIASKQEMAFGKLHDKRLEVMGELFEKITILKMDYDKFVAERKKFAERNPHGTIEEWAERPGLVSKIEASTDDALRYMNSNRIYFSEDVTHIFDSIAEGLEFRRNPPRELFNSTNFDFITFGQVIEKNDTLLNQLTDHLEYEFRKLTGVEQK